MEPSEAEQADADDHHASGNHVQRLRCTQHTLYKTKATAAAAQII
jgi:hypothetical protein